MDTEIVKTLTDPERKRWEELNAKVQQGFLETGDALREIRDRKLYRDDFNNWDFYCQSVREMTKTQANRLVTASEVCEELTPIGVILPDRESHCRELTKLPEPEQRREAWKEVVEGGGDEEITAITIRQVVRKKRKELGILPPPKSKAKKEGAEPDTIEVEAEVLSEEEVAPEEEANEQTETFKLADETESEPAPVSGTLLTPKQVEEKLAAMADNNRGAPDRLRKPDSVIARRQSCLIELAAKVNEIAGEAPDDEMKDALYWAIYELQHLTASLRPVSPTVVDDTSDEEG